MKALFISDAHLDATTGGWPRVMDVLAQIEHAVAEANRIRADLFVFCGDMLDGHAPDERCWTLLAAVRRRLDKAEMERMLIAGNHDVVDRVGCRSALAPLESRNCTVVEVPSLHQWSFGSLLCLPHVSPVHVDLHYEGMERTLDEYVDTCCRDELDGVEGPVVVVSHLELEQIEYGSERDMPCGSRPAKLPTWLDTDPRVAVIAEGHYHTGQKVGNKTHVVGSLERLTFSELNDQKGFIIIEA